MADLWRASLRRIQTRFQELKTAGHSIHAVVTDSRKPRRGWPATRWHASYAHTPENAATPGRKTHQSASMFSGPPDGPYAPGEIWRRAVDLFGGTSAAASQFTVLASDAWECVQSLTITKELIPIRHDFTGSTFGAEELWTVLVFKIAWREIQGSPLRASRQVREDYKGVKISIEVESLNRMRENSSIAPTGGMFDQWIPKDFPSPDYIYSEIEDFVEASSSAIDVLVGDEIVPDGGEKTGITITDPVALSKTAPMPATHRTRTRKHHHKHKVKGNRRIGTGVEKNTAPKSGRTRIARRPKKKKDGPDKPNAFIWKNKRSEGLENIPWKLLNFVWHRKGKKCEQDNAIGVAWGSRHATTNAVKAAVRRINRFLTKAQFPKAFSQKKGWFTIS